MDQRHTQGGNDGGGHHPGDIARWGDEQGGGERGVVNQAVQPHAQGVPGGGEDRPGNTHDIAQSGPALQGDAGFPQLHRGQPHHHRPDGGGKNPNHRCGHQAEGEQLDHKFTQDGDDDPLQGAEEHCGQHHRQRAEGELEVVCAHGQGETEQHHHGGQQCEGAEGVDIPFSHKKTLLSWRVAMQRAHSPHGSGCGTAPRSRKRLLRSPATSHPVTLNALDLLCQASVGYCTMLRGFWQERNAG